MGNEVKAKYDCTQTELYAIENLGWNHCLNHQVQLVIKYPIYTVTYINGKIAVVGAAEAMPGEDERDLITGTDRVLLLQLAAPAIDYWKLLIRYINQVFVGNKPLIPLNENAAGKGFYEAATRENPNWEDLKQMLLDGKDYITGHIAELTPVMPVGFDTDYDTAINAYITKYATFTNDKFVSSEGTTDKVKANNATYDDFMIMLEDLQTIAPIESKSNYTFVHLKSIITTPGSAGLKFDTREEGTNVPLAKAIVKIQKEGGLILEANSDSDGKGGFANLEPGKYKGSVELAGYGTLNVEFEISMGVTSFKHWLLVLNP